MRYVEYDFTANLEEQLDRVSNGEIHWKELLAEFWKEFTIALDDVKDLRVTQVIDALNDLLAPHIFPQPKEGGEARACPSCATGSLSLKLGRFGSFIGCTNYPDCKYTRPMTLPAEGVEAVPADGIVLGTDSETGAQVTRRIGRFGPYLQLGEPVEDEKPKRASIPKGTDPASVTLEQALRLLSLPREVGIHPETKTPIVANFGRFGPYILHDGVYANLESPEDVYTIGLNRAVDLLAAKRARGPSTRGRPGALRDLGQHPDGGAIQVFGGRYGAYVKHGKVNATIPKDSSPEAITLDEAVALIAERAGKPAGKRSKAKTTRKVKRDTSATPAPKAKRAKKTAPAA
jgi:DNA topoisomerase-1